MKRQTMLRLCSLLLAMLLCLPFVGCANETPDDPTPAPPADEKPDDQPGDQPGDQPDEPTVPPVDFIVSGATEYIIVRSDKTTASDPETKLCVKLASAIKDVSGCQIKLTTDYEDEEGEFADRLEILVGKTNRPESEAALAEISDENGYAIRIIDNKLVIAAHHTDALAEAMSVFLADFLGWKSESSFKTADTIRLDAALSHTGVWIDPEIVPDDGNPDVLFGLSQAQVDEFFGDILDGLFTGDTVETIAMQDMGAAFKMHFPDMIYKDGQYWAYYITYQTNTGKGGVGLAVSDDGVNWKDEGCVLQPNEDYDCNGAYFAGVWLDDDGTFYLTYECKGGEETEYGTLENVALATSVDGIHWTKEGVILYKNPEIPWQAANVGTPDLYKKDDTWYLFFHGFDFVDCQIGVAYGKDLHNLTVVPEPIIPTEDNTPYSGTTGRRDVIFVDGYYYMVYEVSTDQAEEGGYNGAYWTHMFARSKDLITWETIEAPLLTQTNADGSAKPGMGYDGPCWMIIGRHIYVYMRVKNRTTAVELTLLK